MDQIVGGLGGLLVLLAIFYIIAPIIIVILLFSISSKLNNLLKIRWRLDDIERIIKIGIMNPEGLKCDHEGETGQFCNICGAKVRE